MQILRPIVLTLALFAIPVQADAAAPCRVSLASLPAPSALSHALVGDAIEAWIDCMSLRPIVVAPFDMPATIHIDPGSVTDPTPTIAMRQTQGPFLMAVGLSRRIHAGMSPDQIRRCIRYVATGLLPLPGLEIEGWSIGGMPPRSHLSGEFQVLAVREDGFDLQIDNTPIFSIYGLDRRLPFILQQDASIEPHLLHDHDLDRTVSLIVQFRIDNF